MQNPYLWLGMCLRLPKVWLFANNYSQVEESRKKGKWLPEDDFVAPAYADADKVNAILLHKDALL